MRLRCGSAFHPCSPPCCSVVNPAALCPPPPPPPAAATRGCRPRTSTPCGRRGTWRPRCACCRCCACMSLSLAPRSARWVAWVGFGLHASACMLGRAARAVCTHHMGAGLAVPVVLRRRRLTAAPLLPHLLQLPDLLGGDGTKDYQPSPFFRQATAPCIACHGGSFGQRSPADYRQLRWGRAASDGRARRLPLLPRPGVRLRPASVLLNLPSRCASTLPTLRSLLQ